MNVHLGPMTARSYTVGAASDPYKKYWWVILAGFVFTGAWLLLPMMETPVGSVHVDSAGKPGAGSADAEQSLDSPDNPSGAAGAAVGLTLDGTKRVSKSGEEDASSMLYQAAAPAAGAAAAGAPLGAATAASASTLAQQLKDAGKPAAAPAGSGWAEKAQRGFSAPSLSANGLSGLSGSKGGSSASTGLGTNFFGSKNAAVTFGEAAPMPGGVPESAAFKAVRAAAAAAAPSLTGSNESLAASNSKAFDGGKGKAPAAIGLGAYAQAQGALSAAPINLKANNAQLDLKKLPDPPMAMAPPPKQDQVKQLAMMGATLLIGGMIPGVGGQMVMMMGMMMLQQQNQQATAASTAALNAKYGIKPSS
ncbi:MAG: hypothetical protein ACHQ49_01620 [Elusimicrobiota bacterium]